MRIDKFNFLAILNKQCGCRITVIMRPCQGREGGSIPLTRSREKPGW